MGLRIDEDRGYVAAFARYGVKHAGAASYARGLAGDAFGHPIEALNQLRSRSSNIATRQEGITAFQPGGLLDPHALLWGHSPTPAQLSAIQPGNPASAASRGWASARRFSAQAMPWVNRTFSVGLPAYEAYQAMKGRGDPREGRLSNVLGALGGGLGWAFGQPLAGWVGAPYIAQLGRALGTGAGRLLGSHPTEPDPRLYAGNPGG